MTTFNRVTAGNLTTSSLPYCVKHGRSYTPELGCYSCQVENATKVVTVITRFPEGAEL